MNTKKNSPQTKEEKLIETLKEQIRDLKRQLMVAERVRHDSVRSKVAKGIAWDGRLLASGVAHEFNNILGAADGHAEWALDSDEKNDMKEALEVVREACARSLRITKGLQGLSGPSEESVEVFALSKICDGLTKHFSKNLIRDSIDLQFSCEPVEFYGNENRFYEVLLNLVKNASEAFPPNFEESKTILVEGKAVKDKLYSLMVKDNGPGIPDLYHERVFEPFFTTKGQLGHIHQNIDASNAPISASASGSGLGLYLSRSIIEEMGGRIKLLKSKSGSCFEITLPIAATA